MLVCSKKVDVNCQGRGGSHANRANEYIRRIRAGSRTSMNQRHETMSEVSQTTQESQVSTTLSVPAHVTASGFAWAKMQKQDVVRRMRGRPSPRSQRPTDLESYGREDGEDTPRPPRHKHHDSFDASEIYDPQELSRVSLCLYRYTSTASTRSMQYLSKVQTC